MAFQCARSFSQNMLRRAFTCPPCSRSYAEAAISQTSQMAFTFGSPSHLFYNSSNDVKQVDVPTGTGAIGILANHVPTLGVLSPGVLSVLGIDGNTSKYFVSSGSYSVNEDASVIITAEEAVRLEDLDKELAKANLVKAQSELSSATTETTKAEANIAIACYESIINA